MNAFELEDLSHLNEVDRHRGGVHESSQGNLGCVFITLGAVGL